MLPLPLEVWSHIIEYVDLENISSLHDVSSWLRSEVIKNLGTRRVYTRHAVSYDSVTLMRYRQDKEENPLGIEILMELAFAKRAWNIIVNYLASRESDSRSSLLVGLTSKICTRLIESGRFEAAATVCRESKQYGIHGPPAGALLLYMNPVLHKGSRAAIKASQKIRETFLRNIVDWCNEGIFAQRDSKLRAYYNMVHLRDLPDLVEAAYKIGFIVTSFEGISVERQLIIPEILKKCRTRK